MVPCLAVKRPRKCNARLIVSQIVVETLMGLKMRYPSTSPERRRELKAIRKRLAK